MTSAGGTRREREEGWHTLYETGCPDLAIPTCEECWLPACRYDLPPKQAQSLLRQAQVRALLAEGLRAEDVAERLGMSRRQVYRLKAQERGEDAERGVVRGHGQQLPVW